MKRYILTGTPGSGKTAILRQLELHGFGVIEEAATDVIALQQARGIAKPWTNAGFLDAITELQRQRQICAAGTADAIQLPAIQFYDRSPICTTALATYLGVPAPPVLTGELERIQSQRIYERRVFFIRNLGFIANTAARTISFEEALRFEQIHEVAYRALGYEIVSVAPAPLDERVRAITQAIAAQTS
jgi:predicted ATPase